MLKFIEANPYSEKDNYLFKKYIELTGSNTNALGIFERERLSYTEEEYKYNQLLSQTTEKVYYIYDDISSDIIDSCIVHEEKDLKEASIYFDYKETHKKTNLLEEVLTLCKKNNIKIMIIHINKKDKLLQKKLNNDDYEFLGDDIADNDSLIFLQEKVDYKEIKIGKSL